MSRTHETTALDTGLEPSSSAFSSSRSSLNSVVGDISLVVGLDCQTQESSAATSISPGSPFSRILLASDTWYVDDHFAGKAQQLREVSRSIRKTGCMPSDAVDKEIDWFYHDFGIDESFFELQSVEAIASIILRLWAAKIAAKAHDGKTSDLFVNSEYSSHAMYIDSCAADASDADRRRCEKIIQKRYLDLSIDQGLFRVESFRSKLEDPTFAESSSLGCYFVYPCRFLGTLDSANPFEMDAIGEHRFLRKATRHTKAIYAEIMMVAMSRVAPVVEVFDVTGPSREIRLVIAYKQMGVSGLYGALPGLYHRHGFIGMKTYVEQFSNGYTIMSAYLEPAQPSHHIDEAKVCKLQSDIEVLCCVPNHAFYQLCVKGLLTWSEGLYAHCISKFVGYFINRVESDLESVFTVLRSAGHMISEPVSRLQRRLRDVTFTPDYVDQIVGRHFALLRQLYQAFESEHATQTGLLPSRQPYDRDADSQSQILLACTDQVERQVMMKCLQFNQSVQMTNFFCGGKAACSFRLDPNFLSLKEYPRRLSGMYMVVGSEFQGFHLQCEEISRGGIRIVISPHPQAYENNRRALFNETYHLAETQQMKNKDIAEGGAKSVILLGPDQQVKRPIAFKKYIDSLLDLQLKRSIDGSRVVDKLSKDDLLYMGPDENTADMMDWATELAEARGSPWWKSTFTGKSARLGGVPHDRYGMTTLSVRAYVEGIYRSCGLNPTRVRKMQTGGPDGDLGSNEILQSEEMYVAIVDGSGVLYDEHGLDRGELHRLAMNREPIANFDESLLSSAGYRVLVDQGPVTLPSGEVIVNPVTFRDEFHLRNGRYDLFVPCGGRPGSIDLQKAERLIDGGICRIPYIVEGANLFLTPEARVRLEHAGCRLYKDASVNKGGVTSSSLEVLTALAFDDDGYRENMCARDDGSMPIFYQDLVHDVQKMIRTNADAEFRAIEAAHERTKKKRSVLSDLLSDRINALSDEIKQSSLTKDTVLRRNVLGHAVPQALQRQLRLDSILDKVCLSISSVRKRCSQLTLIDAGSSAIHHRDGHKVPREQIHVRSWA